MACSLQQQVTMLFKNKHLTFEMKRDWIVSEFVTTGYLSLFFMNRGGGGLGIEALGMFLTCNSNPAIFDNSD